MQEKDYDKNKKNFIRFFLAFMELSDATQSNCNAQRQFSSSSPFQWLLNKFHLQFSHEKSYNMSSRRNCCKCRISVLLFLAFNSFLVQWVIKFISSHSIKVFAIEHLLFLIKKSLLGSFFNFKIKKVVKNLKHFEYRLLKDYDTFFKFLN